VLLGLIVAGVIVAIVLLSSGGGSSHAGGTRGGASASATTSSTGSSSTAPRATEDRRIALRSPEAGSKAVGIAQVLSEGSQYAFYLAAEHMAPSRGFFYAVWLYNSPTSHEPLGRAPAVGSDGRLQGGALLPADAGRYHTMLVTRETSDKPAQPGPVVLRGAFALH
jgi:hypothetical protein